MSTHFRNPLRRILPGRRTDVHALQVWSARELQVQHGAPDQGWTPRPATSEQCVLRRLFDTEGSDKGWHADAYDIVLSPHRERVRRLLEIGIGTLIEGAPSSMVGYAGQGYRPGGSLRGWRNYFPHADILGLDIQPDTQFSEERISTRLCNSADAAAVAACLGDESEAFDVVIDDGSHEFDDQMATLRNFYGRVKPGGFYFIEDVGNGSPLYWNPALIEPHVAGAPHFSVCVGNGREEWKLIVIRKGG